MIDEILQGLRSAAIEKISNTNSLSELQELRVRLCGRNGIFTRLNNLVWGKSIAADDYDLLANLITGFVYEK